MIKLNKLVECLKKEIVRSIPRTRLINYHIYYLLLHCILYCLLVRPKTNEKEAGDGQHLK